MACFDTDTIVIWDSQTFVKVWKIKPPPVTTLDTLDDPFREVQFNARVSAVSPRLTGFTASRQSRYIVASGRTMSLWVWHIPSETLVQEFTTPVLGDGIAQMEFIGSSEFWMPMPHADSRFVHVGFSFSRARNYRIIQMTLSTCSRLLAVVPVFSPFIIKVYPLAELLASLHNPIIQPPPPEQTETHVSPPNLRPPRRASDHQHRAELTSPSRRKRPNSSKTSQRKEPESASSDPRPATLAQKSGDTTDPTRQLYSGRTLVNTLNDLSPISTTPVPELSPPLSVGEGPIDYNYIATIDREERELVRQKSASIEEARNM
ncbi:hypothetical protein BJ085DRAFT_31412 [Dimargaris cristalligena]|uniref:WD40-repeat-containing domain protein n=1 Tax=Dimargaris cristalligena TaxID=215637 RepID=A0A4Q0A1Y8_9FUNG|nr:hypothetical protein BJ085DRAFT_31412 [Dimargaris cristalligena]|eukprot:RKP39180.1 hypothetical protein BJ085DRAFT_31412 [Dimargaris cristalligena]